MKILSNDNLRCLKLATICRNSVGNFYSVCRENGTSCVGYFFYLTVDAANCMVVVVALTDSQMETRLSTAKVPRNVPPRSAGVSPARMQPTAAAKPKSSVTKTSTSASGMRPKPLPRSAKLRMAGGARPRTKSAAVKRRAASPRPSPRASLRASMTRPAGSSPAARRVSRKLPTVKNLGATALTPAAAPAVKPGATRKKGGVANLAAETKPAVPRHKPGTSCVEVATPVKTGTPPGKARVVAGGSSPPANGGIGTAGSNISPAPAVKGKTAAGSHAVPVKGKVAGTAIAPKNIRSIKKMKVCLFVCLSVLFSSVLKGYISSFWETNLTATERHLPYGVSPATQHKWTRSALNPARQAGTGFIYPRGMEGWVHFGDWLYTEIVWNLSADMQSPIAVVTTWHWPTGSRTHDLVIISPTPTS